jgi:hypothetical protein
LDAKLVAKLVATIETKTKKNERPRKPKKDAGNIGNGNCNRRA